MEFKNSTSVINYADSKIAKNENNDCVVRAVAAAVEVTYDQAHEFCKTHLKRSNKSGTRTTVFMKNIEGQEVTIGDKTVTFTPLPIDRITNLYKLYGEVVRRKMTIPSFLKMNKVGTFICTVPKHAFTVKNEILIDNEGFQYKMARKIQVAWKVEVK